MPAKTDHEARSLFVQSPSYGDIVLSMALLAGQKFSEHSAMVLTDRLYATNRDELPVATFRYASVTDILFVVDAWKPDLVFFVSAYGLVVNDFPLRSVEDLVRDLRDRGCRLVTTDPFLGSAQRLSTSAIDLPFSRLPWLARFLEFRKIRRMFDGFAQIRRIFEKSTHLYPVPTDGLLPEDGVRRVSFFNPHIVRSELRSTGTLEGESRSDGGNETERCWLFILGASDLGCQNFLWGKEPFARLVLGKLEQARRQGRRPVLIAPPSLIGLLSGWLPAETRAELVPFCSYAEFLSKLFEAEYVFYWNVLSCSILLRVANSLPAFFFDTGHVDRLLKPCYDIGVRCSYGGWSPSILDMEQTLDAGALADLVADHEQEMRTILAHWQRSLAPGPLIDELLRQPS